MLKRILIPLEESEYSKAAIDYGVHLAKSSGCQLCGLAILDIPSIEKSIGPVPLGGTYYALKEQEQRMVEEKSLAEKLMKQFVTTCNAQKIPNQTFLKEGGTAKIIIDESKYHDLVIMGIETSFRYGEEKDKKVHHQLISHGIRPVLLVPRNYRDIQKILLCYDGSFQATKAIHQLVQFEFWKQRQVMLLTVHKDAEVGGQLLDRMGEYLTAWGISFEKVFLEGHPAEAILNYVLEKDVDLIVLGAYGREGILSFFFGNTAKTLLSKAERPLFIYH